MIQYVPSADYQHTHNPLQTHPNDSAVPADAAPAQPHALVAHTRQTRSRALAQREALGNESTESPVDGSTMTLPAAAVVAHVALAVPAELVEPEPSGAAVAETAVGAAADPE